MARTGCERHTTQGHSTGRAGCHASEAGDLRGGHGLRVDGSREHENQRPAEARARLAQFSLPHHPGLTEGPRASGTPQPGGLCPQPASSSDAASGLPQTERRSRCSRRPWQEEGPKHEGGRQDEHTHRHAAPLHWLRDRGPGTQQSAHIPSKGLSAVHMSPAVEPASPPAPASGDPSLPVSAVPSARRSPPMPGCQ